MWPATLQQHPRCTDGEGNFLVSSVTLPHFSALTHYGNDQARKETISENVVEERRGGWRPLTKGERSLPWLQEGIETALMVWRCCGKLLRAKIYI